MPKDDTDFGSLGRAVFEELNAYLQDSEAGRGPVLTQRSSAKLAQNLQVEKWIQNGGLNLETVNTFLRSYLDNTQHMHHPGYMGHQVAVPHYGAAIADMVNGITNNPMAIYEMGPAAAVVERVIINWMLEKIGWFQGQGLADFKQMDHNGAGVLTHGGSLANLTAVLAARAAFSPEAWDEGVPPNLAMIAPKTAHYSLARAASIAGLGANAIFPAPVTKTEILIPDKLENVYKRALDAGKQVFMVSANACSTSTGLYDPLDEIADFCAGHKLWFHVDGAHGASALLSGTQRHLMKGCHRADSMIWDAHKMLRTSALCAAVLFKDQNHVSGAFRQEGSYIFHDKDQVGFDVMPYAVECTKAPLGVKLFWVLAIEGEKKLGDFVNKQYQITRTFHDIIMDEGDFECAYVPQANILCFKYLPFGADNAWQLALRNAIVKRGKFYITSTKMSGVRYLRLSVMNPLTTVETIQDLLAEIRICAALI